MCCNRVAAIPYTRSAAASPLWLSLGSHMSASWHRGCAFETQHQLLWICTAPHISGYSHRGCALLFRTATFDRFPHRYRQLRTYAASPHTCATKVLERKHFKWRPHTVPRPRWHPRVSTLSRFKNQHCLKHARVIDLLKLLPWTDGSWRS